MIKYFCDICENELKETEFHFVLTENQKDKRLLLQDVQTICPECNSKIEELIASLRPERPSEEETPDDSIEEVPTEPSDTPTETEDTPTETDSTDDTTEEGAGD